MLNLSPPLLVAISSLVISSIWLIHKSELFQMSFDIRKDDLINIDDKKGILIPSLVFLCIPFITARFTEFILSSALPSLLLLLNDKSGNKISLSSLLSPIVTLFTFVSGQILGQVFTNLQIQRTTRKEKGKQVNLLIFKIGTVINYLSCIEGLLMSSIQYPNDNSDDNKIGEEVKKYKLEIDSIYDKFSFQMEYFATNDVLSSLLYIDAIKNLLASLSSKNQLLPQEKLSELKFLRLRQIEGYENIINLKQKLDPDIHTIEGYVKRLQKERHRFLELRETRKICMNHPNNSPNKGYIINPEVEIYRRYDIDTENDVIEKIEDILEQLGIKIDPYKGNGLKDFNL